MEEDREEMTLEEGGEGGAIFIKGHLGRSVEQYTCNELTMML